MRRPVVMVGTLAIAGLLTAPLAAAPAGSAPPNACKTFTTKSLDKLLGISTSRHPKRHLYTNDDESSCSVTYKGIDFGVGVSDEAPPQGSAVPTKYYSRPKLGHGGQIEVSKKGAPPRTGAHYRKHGWWIVENVGITLPHKGKRMYTFALKQSKAFSG